MKQPLSKPVSDADWKMALRASVHPILWLLPVNIAITVSAFPPERWVIAVLFGVVLPGSVLVGLAQTLSTRVARSNIGVFPRAERPIGYWLNVGVLSCAYLLGTVAPILRLWLSDWEKF